MRQDVFDSWVKALESGEYKRGAGRFRTPEGNYCCLGVLWTVVSREYPEIQLGGEYAGSAMFGRVASRALGLDLHQAWLASLNDTASAEDETYACVLPTIKKLGPEGLRGDLSDDLPPTHGKTQGGDT